MTGCFVKNSGSRKHEQEGVSGLRADVRHINRLRNGEKISEVIKNPDIQVGSLKEQPSEITVTLLTEPTPIPMRKVNQPPWMCNWCT